MSYTRYLVMSTLVVAAVVIAAAAPRGPSVLEVTATLNAITTTQGELDTIVALTAASSIGLNSMGRNTLIAPNDAAFDAYFERTGTTLDAVLANPDEVDRLVESHLIRGQRDAAQLQQPAQVRTRAGTSITVENGLLTYEGTTARMVRPDARASNGIVHVINGVLA